MSAPENKFNIPTPTGRGKEPDADFPSVGVMASALPFPTHGKKPLVKPATERLRGQCGVCGKNVMGKALTVGDVHYHEACFVCRKCTEPLSGGAEFIDAGGGHGYYHITCLCCAHCGVSLDGKPFGEDDGALYCAAHVNARDRSDACAGCKRVFKPAEPITRAVDKKWHPQCFKCSKCTKVIEGGAATVVDGAGKVFCEPCGDAMTKTCAGCDKPVDGACLLIPGDADATPVPAELAFHEQCFTCLVCKVDFQATGTDFYRYGDKVYCEKDHPIK